MALVRDYAGRRKAFGANLLEDEQGRIWTSAGRALHCYRSDGELIGKTRS